MTQEEVFKEYHKRIVNYIYGKVSDYDLAEDLASTVFVKMCNKFDDFDENKASITTWIFTIANNTVIDYYRTRKVHEDIEDNDVSSDGEIDEELLEEEKLEELADALSKIPERERDLIVLHYYKNLTLKDVAIKMGMSYANVKIVHNKALMHLREYIEVD